MKYIRTDKDGTHFEEYFRYLETIKDKLSSNVLNFATHWKHYSLHDHESLHDAWLRSMNIVELPGIDNSEVSRIQISLRLLGPYHDRYIDITYHEVFAYYLSGTFSCHPFKTEEFRHWKTVHGDLLTHEVRLTDKEKICHEIKFHKGSSFIIECEDMICQYSQVG